MDVPLLLVDAASLYFRAYYGVPESVTAPDGTPVNAVRGFTDMLARLIELRRPSRLVACLDLDWRPTFRVAAIPSYKAHRVAEQTGPGAPDVEDVPDTLSPQVPLILELLAAAGLATAGADGYEADDVIGALVAAERRDPVEVVSGDRDLFQVVRTEPTPVRVVYVGRGLAKAEVIGPAELASRYGLPETGAGPRYADLAALRGDPSDGLPGVPGVGEKTAAMLISRSARWRACWRRWTRTGRRSPRGREPSCWPPGSIWSWRPPWCGWPLTPRCGRTATTHCPRLPPTRSRSPRCGAPGVWAARWTASSRRFRPGADPHPRRAGHRPSRRSS